MVNYLDEVFRLGEKRSWIYHRTQAGLIYYTMQLYIPEDTTRPNPDGFRPEYGFLNGLMFTYYEKGIDDTGIEYFSLAVRNQNIFGHEDRIIKYPTYAKEIGFCGYKLKVLHVQGNFITLSFPESHLQMYPNEDAK